MFSGFSENRGLWGLLSLAGSQNLPLVDLILYLPVVSAMNQWGGIKEKLEPLRGTYRGPVGQGIA